MDNMLYQKELSTQVTALHCENHFILFGEGQYLLVRDGRKNETIHRFKVFEKVSVHGIKLLQHSVSATQKEKIEDVSAHSADVLLWGQRSFSVVKLDYTSGLCCSVLCEQVAEDWIVAAEWLHPDGHSGQNCSSDFVFLTAHSALLRYSTCSLDSVLENDVKTAFQIQEEADIYKAGDSVASLVNRAQCSETCILFSGCIVEDTAKRSNNSWKLNQHKSNCEEKVESDETCPSSLGGKAEPAMTPQDSCTSSQCWRWRNSACVGGTAFGGLLVWSVSGEMVESRTLPTHLVQAHKGVVFSVRWWPDLQMLTTTSDDRSIAMWSVQASTTNHVNVTNVWQNCSITLFQSFMGHQARVWNSAIINKANAPLETSNNNKPSSKDKGVSDIFVVGVGEDSNVCIWRLSDSMLVRSWRAHNGASVWCVVVDYCMQQLITSGGEGAVKTWSIKDILDMDPAYCRQSGEKKGFSKLFEEDKEIKNIFNDIHSYPWNDINLLKKAQPVSSETATFVRCLSFVGRHDCIVCLDSGAVWLWRLFPASIPASTSHTIACTSYINTNTDLKYASISSSAANSQWQLVKGASENLKGYSVMSTADTPQETDAVAIGGLHGDLFVLAMDKNGMKVSCHEVCCSGKVFALQWVSGNTFLMGAAQGHLQLLQWGRDAGSLTVLSRHQLSGMKQRWFTAACQVIPSTKQHELCLLVGDRAGSVHLYHPGSLDPVQTCRGVHGSGGVVWLAEEPEHLGIAVSTGRDGWIRHWSIKDSRLVCLRATRHTGASWITRFWSKSQLILAFKDVFFEVYSTACNAVVARLQCGGGHRAFDVVLDTSPDDKSLSDRAKNIHKSDLGVQTLTCFYLKEGLPCYARIPLCNNGVPVQSGLCGTRATLCGAVLHTTNDGALLALAGEDNALHLLHSSSHRPTRSIATINSHISVIRALTVIRKKNILPFKTEKETDIRVSCVPHHEGNQIINDDDDIWFISAGGRAQLKVWKMDSKNVDSVLRKNSCPSEEDSEIPKMHSLLGCSEILNHQLREEKPTSWRHHELEINPETRHMDCTAVWSSHNTATVVVASSDAIMRVYELETSKASMKAVCEHSWTHCLLTVDVQWLGGPGAFGDVLLVRATDTAGRLIYWLLQNGTLRILGEYQLHQSGINAVTSRPSCDDKCHYQDPCCNKQLILTGGDDAKIVLSQLSIFCILNEGNSLTKETNVELTTSVTSLAEVSLHVSQVTGLRWCSDDRFVSCSIDQRAVVWNIRRTTSQTGSVDHSLQLEHSIYSGVPDIHGMLSWCSDISREKNTKLKRTEEGVGNTISKNENAQNNKETQIMVYGIGCEVFNMSHCDNTEV